MRVVLLGTYDLGKPRTRLLRECLRRIDPELTELHRDVWQGVADKSVMSGVAVRLLIGLRLLLAYPVLAVRYLTTGAHDVVVIGYLGVFDMLLLAPLARMRGKPVVWDAFLSVYDTYARDRGMAPETGFRARLLRWAERKACANADRIVLDTMAHAALMGQLHDVAERKLDAVLVGAEADVFAALPPVRGDDEDTPIKVLFYGQFIPLHGLDTVVDAALDPRGRQFHWTIVGQGQEAARIDARLADADTAHIERITWIDYQQLAQLMAQADVCLGIFGESDKAGRVIPNKVYQALMASKPLITRDSAAMREIVAGDSVGIYLVRQADPAALLSALQQFAIHRADLPATLHQEVCERFSLESLTRQWRRVLARTIAR